MLHALLERAGTLGVLGLDDLLALPTMRAHPSSGKLKLTARLPRTPGVYLFRDRGGRVLYVGKATNLRTRVRSYFSSEDRRKVPQLLREVEAIDVVPCAHPLEAAVREIRLIHEHEPRFNRQAKAWRSYAYLKLTLDERFPRLAVVRDQRDDGARYLGPFRSMRAAQVVREAIESAIPLRRCTRRVGRTVAARWRAVPARGARRRHRARAAARARADEYARLVDEVVAGLDGEPERLLGPLERRMHTLAATSGTRKPRSPATGSARSRARSSANGSSRAVRTAGRVVLEDVHGVVELDGGRLVEGLITPPAPELDATRRHATRSTSCSSSRAGCSARHARARRVQRVDGVLASVLPALAELRAGGQRSHRTPRHALTCVSQRRTRSETHLRSLGCGGLGGGASASRRPPRAAAPAAR